MFDLVIFVVCRSSQSREAGKPSYGNATAAAAAPGLGYPHLFATIKFRAFHVLASN